MNKVYLSFFALILISVLGVAGLAQAPQTEPTFIYDPATRLFRWLVAGGEPLVRGGLPDDQAFRNFIASERFRQAMLQGLKLSEEQVRLVREAVTGGRFRVESIQPNTYTALFARMVNGDNRNPNGLTVKDIVMWAGTGPIESYIIDIPGLRLAIPKACGNVAIKPVVVTTITEPGPCVPGKLLTTPARTLEDGTVEIVTDDGCTKTITRTREITKEGSRIEIPPNPCVFVDWTWRPILTFPSSPDRKRGHMDGNLRVGQDSLGNWLDLPDHPDATLRPMVVTLRSGVADRILREVPDLRDKKIKQLHVDYNPCTDQMKVLWAKDKWHWKEFILGNLTGLPIGFGLGWWLKEREEAVSVLTKLPFFNPGPAARPTTFLPGTFGTPKIGGLASSPPDDFVDPRFVVDERQKQKEEKLSPEEEKRRRNREVLEAIKARRRVIVSR